MPTVRVYTTEPEHHAVPELRPSKRSLPQWARVLALLIGAGGGAGIGSSMTIPVVADHLGLATKKDLDARFEAEKRLRDSRDVVVDGKFAAAEAHAVEMTKAVQAQAQATQALTRIIRKIRPAAAMATAKDQP